MLKQPSPRPRPSRVPPPKVPLPPKKPLPVKPKPVAPVGPVSSVSEIFVAFLRLCKERLLRLIAVMLLSAATSLLLLGALGLGGLFFLSGMDIGHVQQLVASDGLAKLLADPQALLGQLPLLGTCGALVVAGILFWSWSHTSMLAAAVDEHHGIIESLCTGWKYLFPMLWVNLLFVGITICWMIVVLFLVATGGVALSASLSQVHLPDISVASGTVLSFGGVFLIGVLVLLLTSVVPLTMLFGFIVMIDEGHTNIDALLISRLYVRGHWWDTLFKIFLFSLLLLLLSLPFMLLPFFAPFPGHQIVGYAVSLLSTPLNLLYMMAIYRDLKKAAGKVDPNSSFRCLWVLMAAAGILLPLLAVIIAALTGGPKMFSRNPLKPAGSSTALSATATAPSGLPQTAAPELQPAAPPADQPVLWRDLTGDTSNPLLDIREVTALGKQNELTLTITLAKPLAEYFAGKDRKEYAPLASFYFDVDHDESTGAALPGAAGRGVYDFELNILLAAPAAAPQGRAYPSLYALGPQKRQSLAPLPESAAAIDGSTLTIRLPYERLDAAAGGRLRICFREAAQAEGGLSNDQTVPLK
ncbi:hypothetical protein [Candidatus Electronema sp. JM]|uniref:hypothetical protein n=1 Tax=Candidatus Electronema sp. JM TaxID=3401571 RepID=UPI003AA8F470